MTALRVGFLGDSYRKCSLTRRYQHFFRNPKLAGGLCTILAHSQASEKDTACSSCWWSCHHLAWGWLLSSHHRWCRRTFKETSAVHLRRPVRLLFDEDDNDCDSKSRRHSSTQGAAKQPFSHHCPSRPPKFFPFFFFSFLYNWKISVQCPVGKLKMP